MTCLQRLAKHVDMPYVNITLDVGAAINAHKLLWNYSETFNNVVIHLGDFHFIKENFKVIGILVRNSGFEDVVYQAGVCTSGSLLGVMVGSHYNRAWLIHSIVLEAMERLLIRRYLAETNIEIPVELSDILSDPDLFNGEITAPTATFISQYEGFKDEARRGILGQTPQYWITYIELMKFQHMVHTAVQTNSCTNQQL